MTTPACDWTDGDHRLAVELAWQTGHDFALWGPGFPARLAAVDEVRALELRIERPSPEEWYRRRRADIDHHAGDHLTCNPARCVAKAARAAAGARPAGRAA